ncbi:hypothetical protein DSY3183 [Desulfitobacterium hafniense Y51]|uniref:Redox-sensing transcriptional repressor Rex n=1 Tax=Desulfitobacterium hafniense (strain Y51) TaxID=138119 RepID=Q24SM0_DESHY|nr:hypothetical protein DSY3183 [Desulfitobacterium hafniense Y51]
MKRGISLKTLKIPEATIIRLSVYSRHLTDVDRKGIVTISSGDIAEGVGVSPAQVRKDLAYFGEFGTRGVGYNVKDLHRHILKILGLSQDWSVCLVGMGNLGLALTTYKGFRERGFIITSIFDNDPQKIGTTVNGVEVLPVDRLEEVAKANKTQIGIIPCRLPMLRKSPISLLVPEYRLFLTLLLWYLMSRRKLNLEM